MPKRLRPGRWWLVAILLLGLGTWYTYGKIGPVSSLPPPASGISAVPSPGDWPMYQRDPTHSAVIADGSAIPEGEVKWRFETGEPLLSSVAVVDGRVYLGTGDRRIVALDASSGELVWELSVTGPVDSSPAVAGDLLFVGLRDGRVLSLHKDTGEIQWQFATDGPIYSSPVVDHGELYIGSGDSKLYAFDALTGEERWSHMTGGWVTHGPAAHDGVIAATSQDRTLYLVDTGTGKQRLDYRLSAVGGAPTFDFDGGNVLVADGSGVLRAIDWRQRDPPFEKLMQRVKVQLYAWGLLDTYPVQRGFVWRFQESDSGLVGAPVVAEGRVFVSSRSGALFALNRSNGEKLWAFNTGTVVDASPSVAAQTVFIGDRDGRLYAIDVATGESRWDIDVGGPISSTPVIAGGVIYLTSLDGTLYAIQ